jgi:hypothetical protein
LSDIIINFNTGIYRNGILITKRWEIAKNYLKLWFWIDFIATVPLEEFTQLYN